MFTGSAMTSIHEQNRTRDNTQPLGASIATQIPSQHDPLIYPSSVVTSRFTPDSTGSNLRDWDLPTDSSSTCRGNNPLGIGVRS